MSTFHITLNGDSDVDSLLLLARMANHVGVSEVDTSALDEVTLSLPSLTDLVAILKGGPELVDDFE